MPESLAPDYYRQNFAFLLTWAKERYSDLLAPEEHFFIAQFEQLDYDSQCLLVRLISRKGPWFRAEKLGYAEIHNITAAAEQLIASNLMRKNPSLRLQDLAGLLTKNELIALFPNPLVAHKNQRKETLLDLVADISADTQLWSVWTHQQWGELYEIDWSSTLNIFLLLFFGNSRQQLSEFVLQDLGLYRYEKYRIDKTHRLFNHRHELLHYFVLSDLREQFHSVTDLPSLQAIIALLPSPLCHTRLSRHRARLCNQLAYGLEQFQQPELALSLYLQHQLPPARERQARIWAKLGDYNSAWQTVTQILQNPFDENERHAAERLAPRLAKKIGVAMDKMAPCKIVQNKISIPRQTDEAGNFLRVEILASQFFNRATAPCLYAENHLWNSLLGLWLWPELFGDIPGAFANPFQLAPLDLYETEFQARRPGMQMLWLQLERGEHIVPMQETWQTKNGIANSLVNWQLLDPSLLDLALYCIPAQLLKLIFSRMLFDLANNRSGLPDLIQFFPEEKHFRLIEVKGPGDKIQPNQMRWLEFFAAHNIPAEVCYVSWQN